jgi:DNA-binding beta-propeller fold protein YncE
VIDRPFSRRLALLLLLAALVLAGLAQSGLIALPSLGPAPHARTAYLPFGLTPNAIAVDDRTARAFITGDRAVVVTLAIQSGRVLTSTLLDEIPSAPLVDERDGHVFVTLARDPLIPSNAGVVEMLDARTGARLATILLDGSPTSMAVDDRTGRVFVLSANDVLLGINSVTVLDGRSGRVVRTLSLDQAPQSIAVDARTNHVFVEANGDAGPAPSGSVSMLDATSGRLLRTVALGPLLGSPALDERTGRLFVAERVGQRQQICTMDTANGRLVGIAQVPAMGDPLVLTPDAQSGHIIAGGALGQLSMLDARTGRLLRTLPLRLGSAPNVLAAGGRLFVATAPDTVSVLDGRTGSALHTVTVGDSSASIAGIVLDERARQVFVVSGSPVDPTDSGLLLGPGRIAVVDARSGTVIRRLPAGVGAQYAQVDERAGYLFVLNGRVTVRMTDDWGWLPRGLRRQIPFLPPPPPTLRTVPGSVSIISS